MTHENQPLTHEQALELLPWLVNGSLDDEERRSVDSHLEQCGECRTAVDRERELAAVLMEREATEPSHEPKIEAGIERLRAALEREERRGRRQRRPSRRLLAAGLLQGLVLAGLFGLVVWLVRPQPQAEFRTLSTPETVHPATGAWLYLIVEPSLTAEELQRVIQAAGCRIVDGPTPAGVFTLEAESGRLEEALARLRESPGVLLAEPLPGRR